MILVEDCQKEQNKEAVLVNAVMEMMLISEEYPAKKTLNEYLMEYGELAALKVKIAGDLEILIAGRVCRSTNMSRLPRWRFWKMWAWSQDGGGAVNYHLSSFGLLILIAKSRLDLG
uniref:Pentatricopeptide repeat-containing protein n=1 Tax=Angiostrongylus cantonensis TaxID=6313 RepID=A0A0K0DHR6_ANGCA